MSTWNVIERQPRDAAGRVALTERQRCIADAIRTLTRRLGYAPTIREIAVHCGLVGTNAVAQQLDAMRRKGWVTWEPNKPRTLRTVGE